MGDFSVVTSDFPTFYGNQCNGCSATCNLVSDCIIAANKSIFSTFTVKNTNSNIVSSYSFISADSSIGVVNICDSAPNCFIYTTNSLNYAT